MDNQILTAQHDARVNAAAASGLDTTAQLDAAAQAKAQRQERTAATKARKARCIGHATTGASAQAFPVAPGREALPVPPEKLREVIYRLTPVSSAVQVHSLQKLLRTPPETALKSGTRDERLMLAMVLDVLRSGAKLNYVERALDYALSPTGLSREDHQKTKVQLWELGPYHIINFAAEINEPINQALLAEARAAWTDPVALGLACVTDPIPARPNTALVNRFLQVLGERAKFLPEADRPLMADLSKPLKICLPSQLHDYMVFLKELQFLSSAQLFDRLIDLGQHLPKDYSLDALLHPQLVEDGSYDLHERLLATMIQPKAKKAATKRRSSKTMATTSAQVQEVATSTSSAPLATTASEASLASDASSAQTTDETPPVVAGPDSKTKGKGKSRKPKTDLTAFLILDEDTPADSAAPQDEAPAVAAVAPTTPEVTTHQDSNASSETVALETASSSSASCTSKPPANDQLALTETTHPATSAAPTSFALVEPDSEEQSDVSTAESTPASSVAAQPDGTWQDAFSPIDPANDEDKGAQDLIDKQIQTALATLAPQASKIDKCALTRQHKQQHKRHLKKVRKQIAAARRRRK